MSTDLAATAPSGSAAAFQSVCLGRFVIDLPTGFVRTGDGRYQYGFMTIRKPESISRKGFESALDERERNLKTTKHEKHPNEGLLRKVVKSDRDTQVQVSWASQYSDVMLDVAGFKWNDGLLFFIQLKAAQAKQNLGVDAIQDALLRIEPRSELDIPTAPGFCFNGGFIANEEWKVEEVLAGFDLAQHPDVHISIHFYPLSRNAQDKPLLERVDNGLMKMAGLFSSVHTLRKGERSVAGFAGQEYLVAAPNESKQRAHMFTWETQGGGTRETPFVTIEMTSGHRDDKGNSRRASLTDAQALKLWDSIVGTFRVRPTSAPPAKVGEAPTPLAPLGELAATGRLCPQTGWWQCSEEALPVQGGTRQFIRSGEAMPHVTLLGQASWRQRLKGEQPEHRTATVWELVAYAQASASGMAASQPGSAPDAPADAAGAKGQPSDDGAPERSA